MRMRSSVNAPTRKSHRMAYSSDAHKPITAPMLVTRAAGSSSRRSSLIPFAAVAAGRLRLFLRRLLASLIDAILRRRTAHRLAQAFGVVQAAVLASGTACRLAAGGGSAPKWGVGRTNVSERGRSQNRAQQPAEDELQCAGTRHGCRQDAANVIKKFSHVFFLSLTRGPRAPAS